MEMRINREPMPLGSAEAELLRLLPPFKPPKQG